MTFLQGRSEFANMQSTYMASKRKNKERPGTCDDAVRKRNKVEEPDDNHEVQLIGEKTKRDSKDCSSSTYPWWNIHCNTILDDSNYESTPVDKLSMKKRGGLDSTYSIFTPGPKAQQRHDYSGGKFGSRSVETNEERSSEKQTISTFTPVSEGRKFKRSRLSADIGNDCLASATVGTKKLSIANTEAPTWKCRRSEYAEELGTHFELTPVHDTRYSEFEFPACTLDSDFHEKEVEWGHFAPSVARKPVKSQKKLFTSPNDEGKGNEEVERTAKRRWAVDRRGKDLDYGKFTEDELLNLNHGLNELMQARKWDKEEAQRILSQSNGRGAPHAKSRGAWTEIAKYLPSSSIVRVNMKARSLLFKGRTGRWDAEEIELLKRLVEKHGNDWVTISSHLGRSNGACARKWRTVGLDEKRTRKKGKWTQEEYDELCLHVRVAKATRAFNTRKIGNRKVRDNLRWEPIAFKMSRPANQCSAVWYERLAPCMDKETSLDKEDREWADEDDRRLLERMSKWVARKGYVNWSKMHFRNRKPATCKARFNQMTRPICLGEKFEAAIEEQLQILARRYAPDLVERFTKKTEKYRLEDEELLQPDTEESEQRINEAESELPETKEPGNLEERCVIDESRNVEGSEGDDAVNEKPRNDMERELPEMAESEREGDGNVNEKSKADYDENDQSRNEEGKRLSDMEESKCDVEGNVNEESEADDDENEQSRDEAEKEFSDIDEYECEEEKNVYEESEAEDEEIEQPTNKVEREVSSMEDSICEEERNVDEEFEADDEENEQPTNEVVGEISIVEEFECEDQRNVDEESEADDEESEQPTKDGELSEMKESKCEEEMNVDEESETDDEEGPQPRNDVEINILRKNKFGSEYQKFVDDDCRDEADCDSEGVDEEKEQLRKEGKSDESECEEYRNVDEESEAEDEENGQPRNELENYRVETEGECEAGEAEEESPAGREARIESSWERSPNDDCTTNVHGESNCDNAENEQPKSEVERKLPEMEQSECEADCRKGADSEFEGGDEKLDGEVESELSESDSGEECEEEEEDVEEECNSETEGQSEADGEGEQLRCEVRRQLVDLKEKSRNLWKEFGCEDEGIVDEKCNTETHVKEFKVENAENEQLRTQVERKHTDAKESGREEERDLHIPTNEGTHCTTKVEISWGLQKDQLRNEVDGYSCDMTQFDHVYKHQDDKGRYSPTKDSANENHAGTNQLRDEEESELPKLKVCESEDESTGNLRENSQRDKPFHMDMSFKDLPWYQLKCGKNGKSTKSFVYGGEGSDFWYRNEVACGSLGPEECSGNETANLDQPKNVEVHEYSKKNVIGSDGERSRGPLRTGKGDVSERYDGSSEDEGTSVEF